MEEGGGEAEDWLSGLKALSFNHGWTALKLKQ
jgi:hypothetical protein